MSQGSKTPEESFKGIRNAEVIFERQKTPLMEARQ